MFKNILVLTYFFSVFFQKTEGVARGPNDVMVEIVLHWTSEFENNKSVMGFDQFLAVLAGPNADLLKLDSSDIPKGICSANIFVEVSQAAKFRFELAENRIAALKNELNQAHSILGRDIVPYEKITYNVKLYKEKITKIEIDGFYMKNTKKLKETINYTNDYLDLGNHRLIRDIEISTYENITKDKDKDKTFLFFSNLFDIKVVNIIFDNKSYYPHMFKYQYDGQDTLYIDDLLLLQKANFKTLTLRGYEVSSVKPFIDFTLTARLNTQNAQDVMCVFMNKINIPNDITKHILSFILLHDGIINDYDLPKINIEIPPQSKRKLYKSRLFSISHSVPEKRFTQKSFS